MKELELVFGPPGTGKTTEMLRRLQGFLEGGIAPRKIAYCSFTQEGTNQGKLRAKQKFGFHDEDMPYFCTLHSLAFHLLGLTPQQVIKPHHYKEFSDIVGMQFTGYYSDERNSPSDKYLFYGELLRNNKEYALSVMENVDVDKLFLVRKAYKRYKEDRGIIDFGDMLELCIKEKFKVPVEVAILDEAQDLSTLQWEFFESVFAKCPLWIVAGDDDQAIYQWSGADVNKFLSLQATDTPTVLHQSHRLPIVVQAYSNAITDRITKRVRKEFKPRGELGHLSFETSYKDVKFNTEDTYMILSRNNCYLDEVETWLQQNGLIYERRSKKSIQDDELCLIKEWEGFRKGRTKHLSVDLQMVLKDKAKGDDPWYDAFEWDSHQVAYYRDYLSRKGAKNPNIRLATIHTVKGAEADHVILLSDMSRNTFSNYKKNPDMEERVWYVGATRAAESLTIITPTTNRHYPLGKEIVEWAQKVNP
jgi:superfamily I DNA/RNA helicase